MPRMDRTEPLQSRDEMKEDQARSTGGSLGTGNQVNTLQEQIKALQQELSYRDVELLNLYRLIHNQRYN